MSVIVVTSCTVPWPTSAVGGRAMLDGSCVLRRVWGGWSMGRASVQ